MTPDQLEYWLPEIEAHVSKSPSHFVDIMLKTSFINSDECNLNFWIDQEHPAAHSQGCLIIRDDQDNIVTVLAIAHIIGFLFDQVQRKAVKPGKG